MDDVVDDVVDCSRCGDSVVLAEAEGIRGHWKELVTGGAVSPGKKGRGSKYVESNRTICYTSRFEWYSPKSVHDTLGNADQVFATYNAIAPVPQHHVGKPLQRRGLFVRDIWQPFDLHQTPVGPGTPQSAPPRGQS